MPAWNAQKTVVAAARSILNQTWRNLELLIVDDFSEDRTWEKLQLLAAEDSRVKIFRNKINVGPYVSKNIMLSVARGAWITGHDADDWAHPQRLEQHMRALQQFPTPPRASVTNKIRLEADGIMDRFAPISNYSIDGAARLATISCTFEEQFLRKELGGWDNVRFGADSELIARAQTLIKDEFRNFPLISMLCMNYEGSLTNNASYGVDRVAGPSPSRVAYTKSYTSWHKEILAGHGRNNALRFPPDSDTRTFPAPENALVPLYNIRRNFAAHTGLDPICDEPVTAICSSKRPWFAARVAAMLAAQTHRNIHVIFVAHGPGHDLAELKRIFSVLPSVTILELPDLDEPLGAALNMALDHCQTDLCAKIDDDDFYGPNYIRSSLAALHYSGYDGVGIVGRGRAYVYVEEMDVTGLRFQADYENTLRNRLFGGTISWSRKALSDQRFLSANSSEDTDFFRQAKEKGVRIFSAEASDYVHLRYRAPGAHTWKVTPEEFMLPATVLSSGLRLDLAYSTRESIRNSTVPSIPRADELADKREEAQTSDTFLNSTPTDAY
ncbi:MAG: glycosyltransferase [Paracoccus sp. (in: a-proteobacteria)]|nr:glycosyltransferase [Paracoccus sp. (in: a-proteobacteria)]